ncbi:ROK family protein [Taibaiella koreensis]|uniref:ROK family protein n=1 Tax=Taibaiella koreensis TaxID=1268548 RepID=UPI000E59ACF5|nr:ROK family protein [Taibaiella koreensis]
MPGKKTDHLQILSIDIGGSHIKAALLNHKGKIVHDYVKAVTVMPSTPQNLLATIQKLVVDFPSYDCISAGFPGYVKNGIVMTAPNLGTEAWAGARFQNMLEKALGKPARVVNDADMQGLGVVLGKGFELVITLGTGFGTALLNDGVLLPHLELAHHPVAGKKDYDQYIGDKALAKIGPEEWNQRMIRVLAILKTVINYDTLYIGGGNARKISFPLASDMQMISNRDGIRGGARLWTGIQPGKSSPSPSPDPIKKKKK